MYIHACMHACIHTYIHTYIQIVYDPLLGDVSCLLWYHSIWDEGLRADPYIYIYIHVHIHIHIHTYIYHKRCWPTFSERFWPKVILAYFYSCFRHLFVQKLVLCVLVLLTLVSQFLWKWHSWKSVHKLHLRTKISFWEKPQEGFLTLKHDKNWGFKRC